MDRPGRILEEIIYGSWCDLCDEHLGDFGSYQAASIALTDHLDMNHRGWEGAIPPIAEKEKRGKKVRRVVDDAYVQELVSQGKISPQIAAQVPNPDVLKFIEKVANDEQYFPATN